MSSFPIGVFDSGVGGLSVLKVLQQQLPNEQFLYVADSAYAPYGQLCQEDLECRCQFITQFFIKKQVKTIVIACNTATATMAEIMRQQLSIPIIGLEPAIKPASETSRNQIIGVFATQNTLNSQRYHSLVRDYASHCLVYESPCIGFVQQVEKGELDSPKTSTLIQHNLQPMLAKGIDTLVLGCTHYPFLKPVIQQIANNLGYQPLAILDTADAVAKQLQYILQHHHIVTNRQKNIPSLYYTTADAAIYQSIFSKLLGKVITLTSLS